MTCGCSSGGPNPGGCRRTLACDPQTDSQLIRFRREPANSPCCTSGTLLLWRVNAVVAAITGLEAAGLSLQTVSPTTHGVLEAGLAIHAVNVQGRQRQEAERSVKAKLWRRTNTRAAGNAFSPCIIMSRAWCLRWRGNFASWRANQPDG